MSGTTWSKFFWSDWQSDPALRLCSYAARGLWMDLLCIAAAHDPIGYVAVAGRGLDETSIARMTGGEESEVRSLLGELDRNGVFSRDRQGRIYSRRMVADARKAATARKNGKLGGNPSLGKDGRISPSDNPPDKGGLKPQKPEAKRQKPPVAPQGADQPENDEPPPPAKPNEVETALALWNDLARDCGLPMAKGLTKGRKQAISARLSEHGADGWRDALQAVRVSPFCRGLVAGKDGRSFRADVDFVAQPKSFQRLIEGFYGDGAPEPAPPPGARPADPWPGRVREFRSNLYWNDDWGPRPGRPGCKATEEVLIEFGFKEPMRGAA